MTIQTTKTLRELLEDYTAAEVFTGLDEATQNGLVDFFYFRHLCDDEDKFLHYIHRNINERARQYNLLLNAEAQEVDPLIINLETRTRELTGNTSKVFNISEQLAKLSTITDDKEKQENSTITGTNEAEGSSTASNSYESEDNSTRTDNLANSSTNTSRGRNLHSDTPQANVSANTSSDLDANILWNYASDLDDNYNRESVSGTNTGTQTLTGTNEGSATNTSSNSSTSETTQTGAKTTTEDNTKTTNGTDTKTGRNTETNETEGSETNTLSGRNGHLISEILGEWNNYVKRTDAFLWLCKELEICFMSSLLYGEE